MQISEVTQPTKNLLEKGEDKKNLTRYYQRSIRKTPYVNNDADNYNLPAANFSSKQPSERDEGCTCKTGSVNVRKKTVEESKKMPWKKGNYWCRIRYMRQGKAAEVVTTVKCKI